MRSGTVTNFVALLHGLVKQCVALFVPCLLRDPVQSHAAHGVDALLHNMVIDQLV